MRSPSAPHQSHDPGVQAYLAELPKSLLADMVIDLVRIQHGNERLDGAELCDAIRDAAEPVARARQARLPRADLWEDGVLKELVRRHKAGDVTGAETVRAALRALRPTLLERMIAQTREEIAFPSGDGSVRCKRCHLHLDQCSCGADATADDAVARRIYAALSGTAAA